MGRPETRCLLNRIKRRMAALGRLLHYYRCGGGALIDELLSLENS